jgi:hypothetical protein
MILKTCEPNAIETGASRQFSVGVGAAQSGIVILTRRPGDAFSAVIVP